MNIEQNIFERAKVDFDKLAKYGFKKSGDSWWLTKTFMSGDFKAVVKIDSNGNVTGNVYEADSDEIYFPLRVEGMGAGFAGSVRTEYKKILEDIKYHCRFMRYFTYYQANRLALKIYEKYGDKPVFPWDKFDGYGVFKNLDNNKWYAIIMNINKSKLDKSLSGETEVVNLKLSKDEKAKLLKEKGFYPAYHMNKKNWISIQLDETISGEFLFTLLDESHSFTLVKHALR